jgi:hypothetical protein
MGNVAGGGRPGVTHARAPRVQRKETYGTMNRDTNQRIMYGFRFMTLLPMASPLLLVWITLRPSWVTCGIP